MNAEPTVKMVGFLCRWCSYAGANLAGISRIRYPTNMLPILVPCSSRVDPELVMRAFAAGADGVLIAGCHPGDCHYLKGNYKTLRRFKLLKQYADQMGLQDERLRLEWISASEGARYAEVVEDMTRKVSALGPLRTKQKRQLDGRVSGES